MRARARVTRKPYCFYKIEYQQAILEKDLKLPSQQVTNFRKLAPLNSSSKLNPHILFIQESTVKFYKHDSDSSGLNPLIWKVTAFE